MGDDAEVPIVGGGCVRIRAPGAKSSRQAREHELKEGGLVGMDANPLEDLRRSNEEQYFLKKEKRLLEDLRRDTGRRSERADLAEATGIADEEVLRELQDLGYSRETVNLFYVVPLLQVAWTGGFVTSQERELIVDVARTRNVHEGTAGDVQLQEWLRDKPFFCKDESYYQHTIDGTCS
jgi:hypothetical protein